MARAYSNPDVADLAQERAPGEWQALRGELVALLDQVEGRIAPQSPAEPALSGISRRVKNLREQVVTPEPATRRREALRTVKRAVDRFTEHDDHHDDHEPERDALSDAIAEIRGRQMSAPAAALGRRANDMPEFREMSVLVSGLSGRLEKLEGELRHQRANNGNVSEVANQVEQLTHVVELLAGAVGETGQVKRLEGQIAALGALIEQGPKVDLSALNKRLDDVSSTVGKLAELQAQQMEREITREDRRAKTPDTVAPAVKSIEQSVRSVYDRIDAIERNLTLSSGDFERLTTEMASFTQTMRENDNSGSLVNKVDALAARISGFETNNGDVDGLRDDIASLREAVVSSMEPRFQRIEDQIEALSDRMPSGDTTQVESQLKLLMQRMDETGAQLNGLAKLYSAPPTDPAELEAMATMVAERTSDAMTRKAPAPVAMFGADSLKSIEDRISSLIKANGKAPDYESLANMVAERTSEAVSRNAAPVPAPMPGVSPEDIGEFEKRMTALLNTAGKDTAERLTRLEATLTARMEAEAKALPLPMPAPATAPALQTEPLIVERVADTISDNQARIDAMLDALSGPEDRRNDAMPSNPAEDGPLIDPGYRDETPVRSALEAKTRVRRPAMPLHDEVDPPAAPASAPSFDPTLAERPPRPQSSFAVDSDPFAEPAQPEVPSVEAPAAASNTSTFVAAARRAQRARHEAAPAASSNSLIGRALSRVMPAQTAAAPAAEVVEEPVAKPEKPVKAPKPKKVKAEKVEPAPMAPAFGDAALVDEPVEQQSFLTRYRRPILLAATLVAVSMLALNLVIQRMNTSEPVPEAAPAVEAPAGDDVSLVAPEPRAQDMIDDTATGAINPNAKMSFTKPVEATPMPRTLFATNVGAPRAETMAGADPVTTASIPPVTTAVETFELPPEKVGPTELRQAAADGDARAQFEIGAIYTEGRAVEQDYAEAAKWYERSAAQGFVPAQYRLGNLYEVGQGLEKDLDVAKLWYQRAAEAGNRMAMHNLAALYAGGQMGEQQFDTAAEWFEQAAAKGMIDSQFNLGMLYARGLGVEQNFETSYKWFSLAARNGDKDAVQARDDMAKSLNAEAVSKITNEVKAWKPEQIDLGSNFAPLGTWSSTFDPGEAITSREVVSKVQMALSRLGFDIGASDGLAGPKTTEAIKAFERGTGMTESGKINPRLLAVLGSQPV